MNLKISAFAPVNIAWIKYMGKTKVGPMNSSLSVTLSALGTSVILYADDFQSGPHFSDVEIEFSKEGYTPPVSGAKKLKNFFNLHKLWQEALQQFDYPVKFPKKVFITTFNTAPAASGIATSASSFAAYTLAYAALLANTQSERFKKQFSDDLKLKRVLSAVASKGSGSAGRSLMGPWVEWNALTSEFHAELNTQRLGNLVFLVDSSPKEVSSSEAHQRVQTSPLFAERAQRAEKRLISLKDILGSEKMNFAAAQRLVWEESEDMHTLFHTSVPPFQYQTELSRKIARSVLEGQGPSKNVVLTQDAGANIHLFFPIEEQHVWENFAQLKFAEIEHLIDQQGTGAHYVGN